MKVSRWGPLLRPTGRSSVRVERFLVIFNVSRNLLHVTKLSSIHWAWGARKQNRKITQPRHAWPRCFVWAEGVSCTHYQFFIFWCWYFWQFILLPYNRVISNTVSQTKITPLPCTSTDSAHETITMPFPCTEYPKTVTWWQHFPQRLEKRVLLLLLQFS